MKKKFALIWALVFALVLVAPVAIVAVSGRNRDR